MTPRSRTLTLRAASAVVGVAIGGLMFSRTQPRSILALHRCVNCLSPTDLAGLLEADPRMR